MQSMKNRGVIREAIDLLDEYIADINDEVYEGLMDPDDADYKIDRIAIVIVGLKNL